MEFAPKCVIENLGFLAVFKTNFPTSYSQLIGDNFICEYLSEKTSLTQSWNFITNSNLAKEFSHSKYF